MNTQEIIAVLKDHFDSVAVASPATDKLLNIANKTFPTLPPELKNFWSTCNGIQVGLRDCVVGDIFDIESSIETHDVWFRDRPDIDYSPIPLRGDGCGNYDCLVTQHADAVGSVVFWDHEEGDKPSHLLAGSLAKYLEFLCGRLTSCYLPGGESNPDYKPQMLTKYPWVGPGKRTHPWPFDEAWLRSHDERAEDLLSQPTVRGWLAGQDNLQ